MREMAPTQDKSWEEGGRERLFKSILFLGALWETRSDRVQSERWLPPKINHWKRVFLLPRERVEDKRQTWKKMTSECGSSGRSG